MSPATAAFTGDGTFARPGLCPSQSLLPIPASPLQLSLFRCLAKLLHQDIITNVQQKPLEHNWQLLPLMCYCSTPHKRDRHLLPVAPFQGAVGSYEVSPQSPLLQTKQAPCPLCLLITPASAALPFSALTPATQDPSGSQGPKTEPSIGDAVSPVPHAMRRSLP